MKFSTKKDKDEFEFEDWTTEQRCKQKHVGHVTEEDFMEYAGMGKDEELFGDADLNLFFEGRSSLFRNLSSHYVEIRYLNNQIQLRPGDAWLAPIYKDKLPDTVTLSIEGRVVVTFPLQTARKYNITNTRVYALTVETCRVYKFEK